MDEVIVDVRTGEKKIREFTPEEKARRLLEIEAAVEQERMEHLDQTKTQLLDAVSDLENAKALEAEGIFTTKDVAKVQTRVDTLKAELTAISS